MDITQTDFCDHELIPVKKEFFQFAPQTKDEWGWSRPIYFDRTSNVFRVLDFPTWNRVYEMKDLPEDGPHEVTVESYQWAKDHHTTTAKYSIS